MVLWRERGRERVWARHSDTNDAEDAESRSALASTVEPSGESMRTRQVISRALDDKPAAVCAVTGLAAEWDGAEVVSVWGPRSASM